MNWSVFENRVTDFVIMLILLVSMTMAYKPRLKRPGSILAILGMTVLGSVLIVDALCNLLSPPFCVAVPPMESSRKEITKRTEAEEKNETDAGESL